jgi:hypothetical protein
MGIFSKKTTGTSSHFDALHHDTPKPKGLGLLGIVNKIPILGELSQIGPIIPKVIEIFQDKSGRMSSKRMGAGALITAGIAMSNNGAQFGNDHQFYGGMVMCALGVVLFGLTRWDGQTIDSKDPGETSNPTDNA